MTRHAIEDVSSKLMLYWKYLDLTPDNALSL